jgi:hypothetical protein
LSKEFRQPTAYGLSKICAMDRHGSKMNGVRQTRELTVCEMGQNCLPKTKSKCLVLNQSKIAERLGNSASDWRGKRGLKMKAIGPMTIITAAILALAHAVWAQAAELTFRCSNSASHATWDVKIDPAKNIADGFPATINDDSIAWRDTIHGGNYELDRATDKLTFTNASSTGGYIMLYPCQQVK